MAVTPNGKIYLPEGFVTAGFKAIFASVASSIENGLTKRLALQEIAVGLKAGLSGTLSLTSTLTVAPLVVNANNGNFAQGMTITGGIVTVATPGMYLMSCSLGITNVAGHTAKFEMRQNSTAIAADEQKSDVSFFQVAKGTTVVNCVAGDTLSMWVGDAAGPSNTSSNLALTHFSIAMVQATPV